MRRALAVVALAAGIAAVGAPAQAAPTKVTGTIAVPAAFVANWNAGGTYEGLSPAQARTSCPEPGALDGVTYRFIDLKGGPTKFVLKGPTPVVNQDVMGDNTMEYDIDVWAFDAKCKRIEPSKAGGGTSSSGWEAFTARKPARFAVVSYYSGPYPNLAFTLEYS
jgi:hypothetical protein